MSCEWKNLGTLVSRKIGYGIVQPGPSVAGGVPVIKVNNIISGLKSVKELDTTAPENDLKYSRTRLCGGELVISVVGTIGKTAIIPKSFAGCNLVRATALIDIECNWLAKWVKYYLDSPLGQSYINQNLNTTVQPTLNIKSLVDMPIPIFDSSIIKKVVKILSSLDDKIELNQRINENLERQARTLYMNWCGQCDKYIRIRDIVDNILDYTPNKHNEVVLINSSDVTEGHWEHHTLSLNENLKGHFKKRFAKFDILYSEIRPKNKHFAYVLFDPDNYIASTRLMVIRAKQEMISPSLLYQHLSSKRVCDEFASTTETRSGTFPQGCFADFANIEVPFRPVSDQAEITSFLDNVYTTIEHNDRENRCLTALRDTLLPKLMSGNIETDVRK